MGARRFQPCFGGWKIKPGAMAFSLAAQSGIFYSGFTTATELVKAPDEHFLCAS
jgi:hypothetical protein